MARVRVGVALLVPAPASVEVEGLRRAAGDGALGRIPSHCTLVPPVNVRDEQLDDALDVLRAAAAATAPFGVTLGPPASFLPDSPVLYLPLDDRGTEAVGAIRERVFRAPLARPLTWPFVPHVTIADEMDPDRIPAAVEALRDYRVDVSFDRVHLLRESPGRVWEPIADAAFAPPAVVARGGLELELSLTERPDVATQAFLDREWPLFDAGELGAAVELEYVTIAARRGREVVGVAVGRASAGVGRLSDLLVGVAHRGEGIGSHLLRAFESWAAERGCRRLALRTAAGAAAERFYRDRGWVEEGRLADWSHGREFVLLRRDL